MPKVAYVSFSAGIQVDTTEALIAAMAELAAEDYEEVHLLLSTPGGAVSSGINLYNVLRGMPFKLVTHNVGSVDSIGNAVFLAGDERFACPHSTFRFHGVTNHADGPLSEATLRELLEGVLADQKRIGEIVADRTLLAPEEIAPLFREATTKDATAAVESGIVHTIKDVDLPPGAPLLALGFD
jgi:ATP-dependent Clp protease protease subunit